ncbi:hypothetical protein AAFF_G00265050 [Aldrovandia affinis]|uniref:WH2 domain-containing protein n=1 Tax=Aldrovandia affinis TaxID=143900 RepID=A0AAD7W2F9_9TELE|nr:hypothetical protein AAFF_G00265050 [Aldrovandia affinis]
MKIAGSLTWGETHFQRRGVTRSARELRGMAERTPWWRAFMTRKKGGPGPSSDAEVQKSRADPESPAAARQSASQPGNPPADPPGDPPTERDASSASPFGAEACELESVFNEQSCRRNMKVSRSGRFKERRRARASLPQDYEGGDAAAARAKDGDTREQPDTGLRVKQCLFLLLLLLLLLHPHLHLPQPQQDLRHPAQTPLNPSLWWQWGGGAPLADIQKGARLKKVAQVNDRSAPTIANPKGSSGGVSPSSNAGVAPGGSSVVAPSLGGLFAGGFPVLRSAGQRDAGPRPASSQGARPLWSPPVAEGGQGDSARPAERGSPVRTLPPPPTATPTPSKPTPPAPFTLAPPPPPLLSRTDQPKPACPLGPAPGPAPTDHQTHLAAGRLAPPPAPPTRSPTTELSNRTPPPPPPSAPPPALRNGHLHSLDDFESKFQFHPVDDLPPPEEFKPFHRIYPSKEARVNPKPPGVRTHMR